MLINLILRNIFFLKLSYMENINEYRSKDFFISAVLLSSGKLALKKLEKYSDKITTFVFSDPNHLAEEIIRKHWSRTNRVISLDLIEAINQLKTRIHSGI
jgi:hypothetical protein